jgi:hypothetical protein
MDYHVRFSPVLAFFPRTYLDRSDLRFGGLFLALGNLARTPKLYQAHTVLEVEFQEPSFVPTNDSTTRTRSVFLASQEALRTIEQNLTNQTLLARVVRSEGLAQDGGRALLGQSVVANKSSSTTERTEPSQAATTQNASGVTTFTPLEEALGREWSVWCIR